MCYYRISSNAKEYSIFAVLSGHFSILILLFFYDLSDLIGIAAVPAGILPLDDFKYTSTVT